MAIVIPEPQQNQIMLQKKHVASQYGSKGALRSPAHITLHMPFQWEEEKEAKLFSAFQDFKLEQFPIQFKNYSCFEPRVIFVDVEQNENLFQLQKQVVQVAKQQLNLFNQADDRRGFHPHVTIAFRDLKKQKFNEAYTYYKNQDYEASFMCTSFHMLKQKNDLWESYKEFQF